MCFRLETDTIMFQTTRRRILLASVVALALVRLVPDNVVATAAQAADRLPTFTRDANWPKPLPNNWMLGVVWGIATDARDHVWILQDPTGDWPKGDRTKELLAATPDAFDVVVT